MSSEYYFHRAGTLIRRRMLPFLRILLISTILSLTTIWAITAYYGLSKEQNRLASNLELSVMIKQDVDTSRIFTLAESLKKYQQIHHVNVISPSLATVAFEQELGEDTDAIFTESPFQWSISFALKPEYCDHQAVSFILADLSQKEIVEQTVFNAQAAGTVFARSSMVLTLGLAGATGIFILFLGFLSYVFRAELLQSPTEWFILQTLGAGRGFIAIPHLLFAISACTIGIAIGSGIAQVIRFQYSHTFPWIMEIPLNWLFISLGGITVLCYLTAGFTAISVTKGK
jgi:cell division protein FtsX